MKKVDWLQLGGAPIRNEDWHFQDAGIQEAIKGLATVFGSNVILSGCTISSPSGGYVSISEGWVLIEGEVCYVPAASVVYNGAYYYFEVVELNPVEGLVNFENGTSHNIYKMRMVTLRTYATSQTETAAMKAWGNMSSIPSKMQSYLLPLVMNWKARQSWSQGDDVALIAAANYIPITADSGNVFNCDISAATVAIQRFTTTVQNGTWIALRFTSADATDTVVMADGTSLSNGIDTGGVEYLFKVGEVAWFIVLDGYAVLVNRVRRNEEWQSLTLTNGVTGDLKIRLLDNGDVAFSGFLSIDWSSHTFGTPFATLPDSKYYPQFSQSLVCGNDSDNDVMIIGVHASGALQFFYESTSAWCSVGGRVSTL